jgi:hypothetical protein
VAVCGLHSEYASSSISILLALATVTPKTPQRIPLGTLKNR